MNTKANTKYYLQEGYTPTNVVAYKSGENWFGPVLTLTKRIFLDEKLHEYKINGERIKNELLSEYEANSWLAARAKVPDYATW